MAEEKQAWEGQEKKVTLTGPQLMQLASQERQRLEQANMRIGSLQGFRTELAGAMDALGEIAKNEKGNRIMVSLGAGIYVEAALEENSKAIAAIAGSVFKEKKSEELIKMLGERIAGVDKQLEAAAGEQQGIIARVNQLENIIRAGQQYVSQQAAQQNRQ